MSRRGLRAQLPAFAKEFGILPWHIDPEPPVLTRGELEAFMDFYLRLNGDGTDG